MRRGFLAFFCGLGLLAAGCGGASDGPMTPDDERTFALSDVGELYRLYTVEKHKPPTRVADFARLAAVSPMGLHAIESGDVVVRLGATLTSTAEGPSTDSADEVLAYEKGVPQAGGRVLMLNRIVRTMTADEFKAAKLAGTSSSDARPARRGARSS